MQTESGEQGQKEVNIMAAKKKGAKKKGSKKKATKKKGSKKRK